MPCGLLVYCFLVKRWFACALSAVLLLCCVGLRRLIRHRARKRCRDDDSPHLDGGPLVSDLALAISPRIARRRSVIIIVVVGLLVWCIYTLYIYIPYIIRCRTTKTFH